MYDKGDSLQFLKRLAAILILATGLSAATASAQDELEAYDEALGFCVLQTTPHYMEFFMTGKIPEGAKREDAIMTADKLDEMIACMEMQGFEETQLNDFKTYQSVAPDMETLYDFDFEPEPPPEGGAPPSRPEIEDTGDGRPTPHLFIPQNQGQGKQQPKKRKYIYVPRED